MDKIGVKDEQDRGEIAGGGDQFAVSKIYSIAIFGRRWFDRKYGNTYCTAEILINGRYWGKTEYEYGYGDYYIQASGDMLERYGMLEGIKTYPNTGGREALWRYCSRKNIYYYYSVADVGRKGDL